MRTHCYRTRANRCDLLIAEVVAVGDTQSGEHAWGDTLADTLPVVEAVTLGDTWGKAHALVNTLSTSDTLPEVDAKTIGDTRGEAHALVDTLADTLAERTAVTLGEARDHAMCTHWSSIWLTLLAHARWRQ